MDATIVIQRLYVDVYLDGHEAPVNLLNEITRQLQTHVLSDLPLQLDDQLEMAIRIDKLELDVHAPELASWQTAFTSQVAKALNVQLQCINKPMHQPDTFIEEMNHPDSNVHVLTLTDECTQLLSHFYRKGVLPWWKSSQGIKSYKDAEQKWLESATMLHEEAFIRSVTGNPKAVERLLVHAGSDMKQRLLQLMIPPKWISILSQLPEAHPLREVVLRKMLEVSARRLEEQCEDIIVYWHALSGANPFADLTLSIEEQRIIGQLEMRLMKADTNNRRLWIEKIEDSVLQEFLKRNHPFFGSLIQELIRMNASLTRSLRLKDLPLYLKDIRRHHPDAMLRDEADRMLQLPDIKEIVIRNPELHEGIDPLSEEPQYVSYAGLVLLNPFLPTLFQNRGLLDAQNHWMSEQHQAEALLLLYFLATGDWNPTEDQLTVAKLLTGFPLEEPVPEFVVEPKTSAQIAARNTFMHTETEGFLQAIHTNWRPMRNCTWEGLRNDFLNRSACIRRSGSHSMQYKLTVEPHTLDVLLPFKEWGHSMIKYSWMDEVLVVEWG